MTEKKAQPRAMTRFQRIIDAWIDAEPSRNPRDLARAMGVNPSVVYAWRRKPFAQLPDDESIEKLALAIPGISGTQIRLAIAQDLGLVADDGEWLAEALSDIRRGMKSEPGAPPFDATHGESPSNDSPDPVSH